MSMIKTSELRVKDVVNLVDGRRLGYIGDLELDLPQGRIRSVIILGVSHWFGLFGKEPDQVILWSQVIKIGEDVVLVDLSLEV